jgi:glutamate---cysteine ligase / carboxylate-amine ligase
LPKKLEFISQGHLTLGVELEVQLLDKETWDLVPKALEILAKLPDCSDRIKPEIFQSMLEINSGICHSAQEIEKDLKASIELLSSLCELDHVAIAATASHPFAQISDRRVYPHDRYYTLIDRNQWIARRLAIFGLHVHLGMKDGETCIKFNNFFLHLLPHLLAPTASSPFWQGNDTGLDSYRSTVFESAPQAGHPCLVDNWADFQKLYNVLLKSRSIDSHKDLWWDVRPSPKYGTLELRIADGLATLEELMAMVAFIHGLALWFNDHLDDVSFCHPPHLWVVRENKWRAARYALETDIIVSNEGATRSIKSDLTNWLQKIEPYTQKYNYESYLRTFDQLMHFGTSSSRQRKVYQRTESLVEVAKFNAREMANLSPLWEIF